MFDKPVFSNRNEPITRKDNRIFSGASATPAAQPVADLTTRAALQAAAAEAPTEAPALATPAPIPAEAASSGEAYVSEARLIVCPEVKLPFASPIRLEQPTDLWAVPLVMRPSRAPACQHHVARERRAVPLSSFVSCSPCWRRR